MDHSSLVLARMQSQVEQWEQRSDRRAFFLRCYALMTGNTLAAIEKGQFHDPQWVGQLLHLFADYYFLALDAYECRDPRTPVVWQVAHDAASAQNSQVLQDLLLGINAHINYDLVLTLVDMLEPEWHDLSPEQRRQRYDDHCHVNTIIAATVDSVQDQVIIPDSPWMRALDWALGPLDEHIAARLIRAWREEVWQQAQQMLATRDPEERAELRRLLAERSLDRSQQILTRRVDKILADLI